MSLCRLCMLDIREIVFFGSGFFFWFLMVVFERYYLPNFMDGLTYSLPFVMENLSRLAEDLISICLPKADEHVKEQVDDCVAEMLICVCFFFFGRFLKMSKKKWIACEARFWLFLVFATS
jgi:hypothetical protein